MGFMRPADLIVLGVGVGITLISLMLLSNRVPDWAMFLCCLPGIITSVLVLPIPNYHNTMVAIWSAIQFYRGVINGNNSYKWKGWCIYDDKDKL